jgi:hypothetical protein
VAVAEDQICGEQIFALLEILPHGGVSGDQHFEVLLDLVDRRCGRRRLEKRTNRGGLLTKLPQPHRRSLQPRFIGLTWRDVCLLRRRDVVGGSDHLLNARRDGSGRRVDGRDAPIRFKNKKAADNSGGDEDSRNDHAVHVSLHRHTV